ncbi:MAG: hypothetical protein IPP69_00130 [Flavobacteriales bacterium]|nr:hypothetical protein [Flavobacteriales bacterium]
MKLIQRHILSFLLFFAAMASWQGELFSQNTARKKVKLIHSDDWQYDQSLIDAQRLIGHVHLEYEGTQFFCDSAYLYANEDFDAFSNIRILEPGGYQATGDLLHFDKALQLATMRNNVNMRDREMTLVTDFLTYDLETEIANYSGGGKITSAANKNTLTSRKGSYHSKTDMFYFRDQVLLKNPDYIVNCDTMQYHDVSEVTTFFGPTTITGDGTSIYCENGYYNTKKDQSRFGKNAVITSESTTLKGDSMYYDGKTGIGEVFRNVEIRDTTDDYIISGDFGKHYEKTKQSFVTGHALMTQIFEDDSLFMHADTLRSVSDTSGKDYVYAYHGVKLFKDDLQGKCDSLYYSSVDSTLQMFYDPVLWSAQNQITGDSITMKMKSGKLDKLYVVGNAFIISDAEAKGDSVVVGEKFNQIKGRKLTGIFVDNDLHEVYVEGNGQLIYFPTEDEKKRPVAMGLNQGECSNIHISVKDNELKKIRMETETNSVFTPMKMSDRSKFRLEKFRWRMEERPRKMEDVFVKEMN